MNNKARHIFMAVFASQVRDVYTGLGEEKRELKGTRITKGNKDNKGEQG